MNDVIASLIRPAASLSPDTVTSLARVQDWRGFCDLVSRTECAALIHERLRNYIHDVHIPQEVSDWLHEQHDLTSKSNGRLLDELGRVTTLLSVMGIPTLVLKGPVLAFLGSGLQVRPFHDLDLLVRPHDLSSTSSALRSLGFVELRNGNHDYHCLFIKMVDHLATVIEVHFDIVDRERRYVPDLPGVWDRATIIDILGHPVYTPSVTDHLLLTIMQLPHHHWAPRLLVDIGHVAARWRETIEWTEFIRRARAWGMRVLAGSTLRAAESLLHVALPPIVARFAEPEGYIQKLQWRLVDGALSEQLRLGPTRLNRATPFLVADRPSVMFSLVIRRTLGPKDRAGRQSFSAIVRRLWTGAMSLPPLLSIFSRIGRAETQRKSARRIGEIH